MAIQDRAYALLAPEAATGDVDVDRLRQEVVEAKLHDGDWAGRPSLPPTDFAGRRLRRSTGWAW